MDQRNNQMVQIKRKLMHRAKINHVPISGTFELLPLCNMNCKMCYIKMTKEQMEQRGKLIDAKTWIEMGKICVENGMLFLLLTGGEPFLRRDFKEIYIALHKMGLYITINSNGTLIDEDIVAYLKEYPPTKINLTLYGSSSDRYGKLCQYPQGFQKVLHAIDLLTDAGINVAVNASFTKTNVSDMENMFKVIEEKNIKLNPTSYMFPPIRSAHEDQISEVRFTPEEAAKSTMMGELLKYEPERFKAKAKMIYEGKEFFEEDSPCLDEKDEHIGCMAGRGSFWITWDGRMLPCGIMKKPVVFPFRDGFIDAWRELVRKSQLILLPKKCGSCHKRFACGVCAAIVQAENGEDSQEPPQYLCDMAASYIKLMGEKYEENN